MRILDYAAVLFACVVCSAALAQQEPERIGTYKVGGSSAIECLWASFWKSDGYLAMSHGKSVGRIEGHVVTGSGDRTIEYWWYVETAQRLLSSPNVPMGRESDRGIALNRLCLALVAAEAVDR